MKPLFRLLREKEVLTSLKSAPEKTVLRNLFVIPKKLSCKPGFLKNVHTGKCMDINECEAIPGLCLGQSEYYYCS